MIPRKTERTNIRDKRSVSKNAADAGTMKNAITRIAPTDSKATTAVVATIIINK